MSAPEIEYFLDTNVGPTPALRQVWSPLDYLEDLSYEDVDIPMDFVETLCDESVRRLKASLITTLVPCVSHIVRGMEVGDDRVDASQNPMLLSNMIHIQKEVFGMETSEPDTYISDDNWNFCEVTSQIPCGPEGSLDYARKTKFDYLEFSDSPTIRVIIDVQKADRSHSSTKTGKANIMCSRASTPQTHNKTRMNIASWFQDGCLVTTDSKEPKYMSKMLGGSGGTGLFGEPDNSYLYMLEYKHGSYSRVYGSAIQEARTCVSRMDYGDASNAILCQRLREKQDYLHATFAGNVMIPPKVLKPLDDQKVVTPLYTAAGTKAFIQGMENRLIQTRTLVTRRAAEVEMMRSKRIVETLFGYENVLETERVEKCRLKALRDRFEGALSANSAVQNLLNRHADGSEVHRLIQEGFLYSTDGVLELTRESVHWIDEGGKGQIYTIHDLPQSQDMYLRSEVSMEESLRISGIPLLPAFNNKRLKAYRTRAEIGLWQVSAEKEQWAENIGSELQKIREMINRPLSYPELLPVFYKNREWVSDDTLIVGRALEEIGERSRSTAVLLSADFRLARNLARTCSCNVIVIRVESIINCIYKNLNFLQNPSVEELKSLCDIKDFAAGVPEPTYIYVDSGSSATALMRTEVDATGNGRTGSNIYRKTLQSMDKLATGRTCTLLLEKLKSQVQFHVTVISSNGTERKCFPSFNWEPVRRESSFRAFSLSKRFSKGTKGT